MGRVNWCLLLVAGLLITGFWNASAHAAPEVRWLSIDVEPALHEVNSRLQVADTAVIKQKGMAVDWQVRFQCPKGEKYTLSGANLGNLNPESVPPLQDGDGWIYASQRKDVTGTCLGLGKWQTVNLHLYTVEAHWGDTWWQGVFYPAGTCLCPLVPEVDAETNVGLNGNGFHASYASNVGATYSANEKVDLIERKP
jgi:hypothetical protein